MDIEVTQTDTVHAPPVAVETKPNGQRQHTNTHLEIYKMVFRADPLTH